MANFAEDDDSAERPLADDGMTAGGNAHSGNAGPSDGGRIANEADPDDTLTSDDASECLQIFTPSYMLMFAQTSVVTVTPVSAVTLKEATVMDLDPEVTRPPAMLLPPGAAPSSTLVVQ